MSLYSKIVWSEGLFLQPQHFQQQERYFERLLESRLRAAHCYSWGFAQLEIDEPSLNLGKLAVNAASGVFPDGTPFAFPGDAVVPPPLDVPGDARDDLVVLAIPLSRPGVSDVDLNGDTATPRRSGVRIIDVADATATERATPTQVAELTPRLALQRDLPDGFATLGVAHAVEREATNRVILDRGYIPPSLSARDQPVLANWLRELVGLVQQRADALAAVLGQPGRGGVGEIADFLLLQVVNRYGSLLPHLAQHPLLHPERLYSILLELAGELCTFARENRRPGAYPQYLHDDLRRCFTPVMNDLRRSLSMVIEKNAIPIELREAKYGVRVAVIPDQSLLRNATFVLAVSAQMPGEAVRARFPAQIKIGPVEKLRDLVNLQLPGIGLRALPVAPRQIPFHAGANYFEFEQESEFWRQLEHSGGLSMHIAGEFPGLQLECWAIRNA